MEHNLVSEWDFLYNKAHNEFLNFLATTGLVGFSAYVLLLTWFGVLILVQLSSSKNTSLSFHEKVLLSGLASGVAALSVSNFFGFSTVTVNVLMYLFFAVVGLFLSQTSQKDTRSALSSFHYLSLGMMAMICFYLLMIIYNMWHADLLYTKGKNLAQSTDLIQGAQVLEQAVLQSPHEAAFQDQLASAYAQIAIALAESQESTLAAQFSQKAIDTSNQALALNAVHLNLYKDRARIFILLAQINPAFLDQALQTLEQAQQLAPTDPKLAYNRALILLEMGQIESGQQLLEKTIEMKPNYAAARNKLGDLLAKQGKIEASLEQYQFILDHINPEDETSLKQIEILTNQLSL